VKRYKNHIFLIGFMGSGKTSLGKLLARKLKFEFSDSDLLIEEQEKSSIQEIFSSKGESYFREKEHEVLLELGENNQPTIFSTGGGMPLFNDNLSLMKKKGLVVFLDVPIGMLYFRLKNDSKRPLLASQVNLLDYIETTLNERIPVYQQADFTVNGSLNKSNLVEEIINFYSKKQS
jgi:shikimate kinase